MIEHLHEPEPDRINRPRLANVSVERRRCPACGDVNLREYRSLSDQGDGSARCWVRCLCGRRSRVLLE